MLNLKKPETNLEEDAISTFRRISTGSMSESPASSPAIKEKSDPFRVPEVPRSSSTNREQQPAPSSMKRKIETENNDHQQHKRERSNSHSAVNLSTASETRISKTSTVSDTTTSSASASASRSARPKPSLDLAYNGTKTLIDLFPATVKQALIHYLTVDPQVYGKRGVEIEAKFGHLEHHNGLSMQENYPYFYTTLINPLHEGLIFKSEMTEAQHSAFNKYLNSQVEARNPAHPEHYAEPPLRYEHTRLTDSRYPSYRDNDGRNTSPRVTTNDKDGSIVEVISKDKIDDIHFYCPNEPFDIRLSINIERTVPAPNSAVAAHPIHVRKKDRLTYKLPSHRIDLTKVDDKTANKQVFEMEVEMTDIDNLNKYAELEADQEPSLFDDILMGFLRSIDTLNKTATKFGKEK